MAATVQHDEPRGDDELLARIAGGNQSALSELIARHGRGLRMFAARYLGNAGDAEDVVQEVFVTVWKQAARFDPAKGRASTWLYRITPPTDALTSVDAGRYAASSGWTT
ncbi:DNA-directed RNA polymerase specialized sigma24 family protein [Mesorhizobium jarvisii]